MENWFSAQKETSQETSNDPGDMMVALFRIVALRLEGVNPILLTLWMSENERVSRHG